MSVTFSKGGTRLQHTSLQYGYWIARQGATYLNKINLNMHVMPDRQLTHTRMPHGGSAAPTYTHAARTCYTYNRSLLAGLD